MSFIVWLTEFLLGWSWEFIPCKRWDHDITRCPGHWERKEKKYG